MRQAQARAGMAVLLAIAALLGGCTRQDDARSVRVAYPPIVASLPADIAEQRGLYSKHGVQATNVGITSSNDMINALVAGQVDVLPAVSLIPVAHLELQHPGMVRLFSHSRMRPDAAFDSILVNSESPIQALTDLQNKKVGVFPGTSATKLLQVFLGSNGIAPDNITFVQLPPPSQLASLEAGAIDALFSYEPTTTAGKASGRFRELYGSVYASLVDPCPIGVSVVSRAFEREHTRAATGAIEAIDEAVHFIRTNPSEARPRLSAVAAVPPELIAQVNLVDVTTSVELDVGSLQRMLDLLHDAGELPERLDAHRLTDPTTP